VNRQLSMTDKKQPSNGSSPIDTSFMGQLQVQSLFRLVMYITLINSILYFKLMRSDDAEMQ
jgi:hypothetical protein